MPAATLVISLGAPLAMPALTASASETFNSYPISSSYTQPGAVTTAGGSLWYVELGSEGVSGPGSIGNMTTSGTTADYSILPSGATSFKLADVTTGPDGNVWFDGCANGESAYAGSLNVSTDAVTFYASPLSYGCSDGAAMGPIATGPDNHVWYAVNDYSGGNYTNFLFSVNPSTGTTTQGWEGSSWLDFTSMTTGSDGRLWVTDDANSEDTVNAFTISSGTASWTGEWFTGSGTSPSDIVSGPDGNLWFIDKAYSISKSTTSGSFTAYSLPSNVTADQLATGPDGAIWFTGYNGTTPVVGRVTTSGTTTTYNIPTVSGASVGGNYITLGPDNEMWFSYGGDTAPYGLGSITTEPFFNSYPVSSSYTTPNPTPMVTDNGSMWYAETDSNGNNDIGKMTTSGTTTDYAVMPSGESSMKINDITTGPDGNVWFDGCAATSPSSTSWTVEAGYLNVSTGVITFYPNTSLGLVPCSYSSGSMPGSIVTGPDGNVWYVVNTVNTSSAKAVYLFSIDPSTGATTTGWTGDYNTYTLNGLAVGSDGRLWATSNTVNYPDKMCAFTISSGSATLNAAYPTVGDGEDIISGPDGNLWFGDSGYIGKMTTSGTLTRYALNTNETAKGLATGPDGAIWFTSINGSTGEVGRMTTSGTFTEYNAPGSGYPDAITLGPDNAMWFSYQSSSSIGRLGY